MKSKTKTIIWGSVIFFLYFILVNTIPFMDFSPDTVPSEKSFNGFDLEIVSSDSISVIHEGKRWYGTFSKIGGIEDIYLLGIIKLPKRYNGFNFIPLHIFFLIISSQTLLLYYR